MNRRLYWLLMPIALGLMLAVAFIPWPVQPYQDFQVLYHADMGLLRGIPLYDHAGQVNMIAKMAGVSTEQVWVLPFPYPPWVALSTLFLALVPIEIAARLWMELNLVMLISTVWLMTEGWVLWRRLISFVIALLFIPALGALMVGQYVFPALLGAALLAWSLQHDRPALIALSAALLTFKPHIGGLVILAALVYLWTRRDSYGRRAIWWIALTGFTLFAFGFLADRAWPLNYLHSLFGFKGASACRQCISFPMSLVSIWGWGLDQAIIIAAVLLLGLGGLLSGSRFRVWKEAGWIAPVSICIALAANPYLQSYDFSFLLLPLFFLAGTARGWADWTLFSLAYLLPWLRLVLPVERGGDAALLLSALLAAGLVFIRVIRKSLDLPSASLYNQRNSLREE